MGCVIFVCLDRLLRHKTKKHVRRTLVGENNNPSSLTSFCFIGILSSFISFTNSTLTNSTSPHLCSASSLSHWVFCAPLLILIFVRISPHPSLLSEHFSSLSSFCSPLLILIFLLRTSPHPYLPSAHLSSSLSSFCVRLLSLIFTIMSGS